MCECVAGRFRHFASLIMSNICSSMNKISTCIAIFHERQHFRSMFNVNFPSFLISSCEMLLPICRCGSAKNSLKVIEF